MAIRLFPGPALTPAALWNQQYESGEWNRLADLREQARYAILATYLQHMHSAPSILDVGCGDGHFFAYIRQGSFGRYIGLDLSYAALEKAAQLDDPRCSFLQGNAETFEPAGTFDAIVFNQILGYLADPVGAVRRYAASVEPRGLILISLFRSPKADCIRRALVGAFAVIDETKLTNSLGTWYCMALSARTEVHGYRN